MTLSTELHFDGFKAKAGLYPFMAAAFAPVMITSAMMLQGCSFWLSASRSFLPFANEFAKPLAEMPKVNDAAAVDDVSITDFPVVATLLYEAPSATNVPESAVNETPVGKKPVGLEVARDGQADDLTMIAGIGPKTQKILHDLGFFHFDQIADWTNAEVEWIDGFLNFKGRITRDNWLSQAEALALGGRDEYVKHFGKEPR